MALTMAELKALGVIPIRLTFLAVVENRERLCTPSVAARNTRGLLLQCAVGGPASAQELPHVGIQSFLKLRAWVDELQAHQDEALDLAWELSQQPVDRCLEWNARNAGMHQIQRTDQDSLGYPFDLRGWDPDAASRAKVPDAML
jgi:hypothetical protein